MEPKDNNEKFENIMKAFGTIMGGRGNQLYSTSFKELANEAIEKYSFGKELHPKQLRLLQHVVLHPSLYPISGAEVERVQYICELEEYAEKDEKMLNSILAYHKQMTNEGTSI